MRDAYTILVGNPEGKRPVGRAIKLSLLKRSVQFPQTIQLCGMTGKVVLSFRFRLSAVSVASEGEGKRTFSTCQYFFPFSLLRSNIWTFPRSGKKVGAGES
jgi:hypothetical protein